LYPLAGEFAGATSGRQFHVSVIDRRVEDNANGIAWCCERQNFSLLFEKTNRLEVGRVRTRVNNP
jgi:hypothetical protein